MNLADVIDQRKAALLGLRGETETSSRVPVDRRRADPLRPRRKTDQRQERNGQILPTAPPRSGPSPRRLPFVEAPLGLSAGRREARIRTVLTGADLLAGACALVIVGTIYASGSFVVPQSLLMLPVVVLLARALGLYRRDEIRLGHSTLDESPQLFHLATLFVLAVWTARHAVFGRDLTGAHVIPLLVTFFLMAFALRVLARTIGRKITSPERCLLIGDVDTAGRLERALSAGRSGASVVLSMPSDTARSEQESFSMLSDPRNLASILKERPVDRLIIAPRDPAADQVVALVHSAKLLGLRITILPFLDEVMGASAEVESIGGVTVLGLPRYDLSRSERATKRGLDIFGALSGLVLLSPILLVVWVLVKVDSKGPALFRQTRTGRDGKKFSILKFRTMVDGADERKQQLRSTNEALGLFKIANDPRITRAGRLLRKTSLDELPQLWNVLRGDMSLVGPRPLVEDEDAKVLGWFRHRLQLRPGMTGHWQVLGSSRIPLHDMVRIDCLYVANWSLWRDVKLLLQTVPYMVLRRGL